MAKKTQVDIDDLKAALKILQELQGEVGKSGSAANYMQDVEAVSPYMMTLLGDTGTNVGKYVDARTTAIRGGLTNATAGVSTAVGMLTTTISNYETNEKTHTDAANATGNGGDGGRGKGGS